jgi:sec-independent protein translocase protein TatA
MPFIGHLPELLIVLVIGLLVFGPKRMIEMGSTIGKTLRELRESVKDIPGMGGASGLGGLLGNDQQRRTPLSTASQFAQNLHVAASDPPSVSAGISATPTPSPTSDSAESPASATAGGAANDAPTVVDASVEHVEERAEE